MTPAGFLLFVSLTLVVAQKQKIIKKQDWDYKNEAERVNPRGCSNLTLVLDNWKYAIMTQVKDLLVHDHNTVLPDYGRIQPLSDALGDLYREFNGLKQRLAELTGQFDGVESFVDSVRSGRKKPAAPRGTAHRQPGTLHRDGGTTAAHSPNTGARTQARRTRVVVRKIQRP